MVFCTHCQVTVAGYISDDAYLCCEICGKVLEHNNFSTEATFYKNTDGQSKASGHLVRTIQSEYSSSRERTLDKAYEEIRYINSALGVGDDNLSGQALAFYKIALERNFTKGRRAEQVQAACLYIAFRENKKPYLLIDFSNYLRTNVYVLGAVFLQLCKVLRLEEHPIVQKPVDPSLFIPKYTNNLLKDRNLDVSNTAMRIIASMKRDWMQTGRKPSALCGAAIYISALAHGFKYSKSDILKLVHVCEATLTKRLVEFENTESASLTIEELNAMAKEHQRRSAGKPQFASEESKSKDLLCEHKDGGDPHFALGLCGSCYKDFLEISGGLDGGVDPPAFQRAEKERSAKSVADAAESTEAAKASDGSCRDKNEEVPAPHGVGAISEHFHSDYDNDTNIKDPEESDSLSDIDDLEVDAYLHNEEEKHYKKIIWEEMNREYLEEQAAKEAAAAAANEAFEAAFRNCPEELQKAKELAASTAEAVAKLRKEKQRERLRDAKNAPPAQTPAEATQQMLKKKRLSNKVNYDVLEKLFEEVGTKKMRSESGDDGIHESKKQEKESANSGNDGEVLELGEFADEGEQVDTNGTVLYDDNGDVIDYDNDDYGYDGY